MEADVRFKLYEQADAIALCYSIKDAESFWAVAEVWHPELMSHRPNVPFIVVGTLPNTTHNTTQHSTTTQYITTPQNTIQQNATQHTAQHNIA